MASEQGQENQEFWQQQSVDALVNRLAARNDVPLSDEQSETLDRLLWDFVEGQLSDSDARRLWEFAAGHAETKERLSQILKAAEQVAKTESSDPAKHWARSAPAPKTVMAAAHEAATTARKAFDAVIRFASDGLELLGTSGTPAYAFAAARGDAKDKQEPTPSVALEFLTSVGVMRVVIDQVSSEACNLTVTATKSGPNIQPADLDLELRDAQGELWRSEPFEGDRAQLLDLPPGPHKLVFSKNDVALAELFIDLQQEP